MKYFFQFESVNYGWVRSSREASEDLEEIKKICDQFNEGIEMCYRVVDEKEKMVYQPYDGVADKSKSSKKWIVQYSSFTGWHRSGDCPLEYDSKKLAEEALAKLPISKACERRVIRNDEVVVVPKEFITNEDISYQSPYQTYYGNSLMGVGINGGVNGAPQTAAGLSQLQSQYNGLSQFIIHSTPYVTNGPINGPTYIPEGYELVKKVEPKEPEVSKPLKQAHGRKFR